MPRPSFKKGVPRPPNAGRRRGTPNKVTVQLKDAIRDFAERNAGKVEELFSQVSDPAKALDLYARILEYALPKLQRSEVTGRDGEPVSVTISIKTAADQEDDDPEQK